MILSPRAIIGRNCIEAVGRLDLVEERQRPARGAAVQWAAQRSDGGDDTCAEVRSGRSDDAGGERRGVEAVVDRRDHVLLDSIGVIGQRLGAVQHPQVVGGIAEVITRLDTCHPAPQSVQRAQQRRCHGAQEQRVGSSLCWSDVDGRPKYSMCSSQRQSGPQTFQRLTRGCDRRQDSDDR